MTSRVTWGLSQETEKSLSRGIEGLRLPQSPSVLFIRVGGEGLTGLTPFWEWEQSVFQCHKSGTSVAWHTEQGLGSGLVQLCAQCSVFLQTLALGFFLDSSGMLKALPIGTPIILVCLFSQSFSFHSYPGCWTQKVLCPAIGSYLKILMEASGRDLYFPERQVDHPRYQLFSLEVSLSTMVLGPLQR